MIGALSARLAGLALQFGLAILLARALGTHAYGIYAAGSALAAILAGLAVFGLPNLLSRDLARSSGAPQTARLLRSHAAAGLFLAACVLALAVMAGFAPGQGIQGFNVALVLFPLLALAQFRQSAALPFVSAMRAIAPEQVIAPIALIAILGATGGFSSRSLEAVLGASAVSMAAGIAAASPAIVRRAMENPATSASGLRTIFAQGLPFFLAQFPRLLFSNADIVVIGLVIGAAEAGAYALASRMAGLVSLPLFAVNLACQPLFAKAFHGDGQKRGADLAVAAAFLSFAGGAAIAAFLLLFGNQILALAIPGIALPHGVLAVLAAAQLANCAFGPNGMILLMSGHEKLAAKGAWIQAVVLVVLTALFASQGSLLAAAIGVMLAAICGNLALSWLLWWRTGIVLHPFANRERMRLSLTLLRR